MEHLKTQYVWQQDLGRQVESLNHPFDLTALPDDTAALAASTRIRFNKDLSFELGWPDEATNDEDNDQLPDTIDAIVVIDDLVMPLKLKDRQTFNLRLTQLNASSFRRPEKPGDDFEISLPKGEHSVSVFVMPVIDQDVAKFEISLHSALAKQANQKHLARAGLGLGSIGLAGLAAYWVAKKAAAKKGLARIVGTLGQYL